MQERAASRPPSARGASDIKTFRYYQGAGSWATELPSPSRDLGPREAATTVGAEAEDASDAHATTHHLCLTEKPHSKATFALYSNSEVRACNTEDYDYPPPHNSSISAIPASTLGIADNQAQSKHGKSVLKSTSNKKKHRSPVFFFQMAEPACRRSLSRPPDPSGRGAGAIFEMVDRRLYLKIDSAL